MQMLGFKYDWMLEIAWQVPREPSPVYREPSSIISKMKAPSAT